MVEYNWIKNIGKFLESFGYWGTKFPTDPYIIPEMRINNMYPYTVEQTVKVTHYSKPNRRDPARNWRKK